MRYTEGQISILRRLHGMLEFDGVTTPEEFITMSMEICRISSIPVELIAGSIDRSIEEVESWTKEGSNIPAKEEWPGIVQGFMTLISKVIDDFDFQGTK